MGKSWSQTIMQDMRTLIEGGEGTRVVATPESILSMPGSIALGEGSHYTYTGEYTPEVAASVEAIIQGQTDLTAQLVTITEHALEGIFAANRELGEQVGETRLGEASVFVKYLPYAVLAVLGIFILTR
jgi:hypothetical protein